MTRKPLTTAATALAPLLAAALVLHGGSVRAADADAGFVVAKRWCAECHVVGLGEGGTDAAPAFPSIARRHGPDRDWLRAWLSTAHPRMPDLHLTREEIDDVIAYLGTLPR